MAARLSFDERCVISAMVGVGASAGQIADELGRHSSRPTNSSHMRVGFSFHRGPPASDVAYQHPIMEDPSFTSGGFRTPRHGSYSPLISEEPL